MPNIQIVDMVPGGPLTGTEKIEMQLAGGGPGSSLSTTAQAIADLAAGGGGGGAPVEFAWAWYAVDAAIEQGDVIDGADLRVIPGKGLMDMMSEYAGPVAVPPAFPLVEGAPLTGSWVACEPILSATDWTGGGDKAVGCLFVKNNAATGAAPVEIVFAAYTIDAAIAAGDVISGADLRKGAALSLRNMIENSAGGANIPFPIVGGTALSGSWVALQDLPASSAAANLGQGGYFLKGSAPPAGVPPLTVYAVDATMAANSIAVANFANAGGSAGAPITISLPLAPADGDTCDVWTYDPDISGAQATVDGNGKNLTLAGGFGALTPTITGWSTLHFRFNAALDVWLLPTAF